jgi:hypothetical protein
MIKDTDYYYKINNEYYSKILRINYNIIYNIQGTLFVFKNTLFHTWKNIIKLYL